MTACHLDVQDHSGTPRINPYVPHSMHLHLDLNKALAIPMESMARSTSDLVSYQSLDEYSEVPTRISGRTHRESMPRLRRFRQVVDILLTVRMCFQRLPEFLGQEKRARKAA